MATETAAKKSCGPQLSDNDLPSHDWDVDRLGDYAKRQYQVILKCEQTLAPYYWRLGQALSLARKNFNRGQWGQYLVSFGIDKTRSSKACAIFGAFPTSEAVESMSVEEAYQARRSQVREKASVEDEAVLPVKLGKVLTKMERVAGQVFDNVAQLTRVEKEELLKNVRQAIACLQARADQLKDAIEADTGAAA